MNVERIDHLVLTVRDIDATCAFYARVLGFQIVTFDGNRRALQFGQQKINLHQAGSEFEPRAARPTPGSADFCLITREPLADVLARLNDGGVPLVGGPVPKTGALGAMQSVYFRDPDGNLLEVSRYLA